MGKGKGLMEEFKKFIMRGNVMLWQSVLLSVVHLHPLLPL